MTATLRACGLDDGCPLPACYHQPDPREETQR